MLFRLSDVYKSYGVQDVLRGASLQVNAGEPVGLVGRNGAGKSTIFRLVRGEETADRGDVIRARGVKLGLLDQHVHFKPGSTVHESALAAFGRLQQIEHEMHELEHRMAEAGDDLEKVLERYSDLQQEFEHEGGFEYAARAEAILQGLGFDREMWSLPTENLSGGQQNRLGLACLLLAAPDILLLDEPTNHLDVNAVEWLEEFLQGYEAAYVIVSHDRYFLDRSCRRIIELENGRASNYTGNYSDYLVEREERREAQQRAYDNQQQLIAKTEEFIRRNIAGQKTKQAKSRRKMLEKLERVDAVRDDRTASFGIKGVARAGDNVLAAADLAVGYGQKALAREINFLLRRGERLGIIGPNGTGKTTFLKTLIGDLEPLDGGFTWGANVQMEYFDQELESLDLSSTVIEEIAVAAPRATPNELRGYLARFLFTGDDIFKPVAGLSGGEKSRLALAKLIYSQANVLVLDEPTNHLDIPAREALEQALVEYPGTIITVSHDRYFLDKLATEILHFDNGAAVYHTGSYSDFYAEHHRKPLAAAAPQKARSAKPTAKPRANPQTKTRRRKIEEIEQEIHERERDLAALSEQLANAAADWGPEKYAEIGQRQHDLQARLESLYGEWEASGSNE